MKAAVAFDITCDMGEGSGNRRMGDGDAATPLIGTANLACGFRRGPRKPGR